MSRGLMPGLFCVLCLLGANAWRGDDVAKVEIARDPIEPAYAGRGLRAWTAMLEDPQPVRRIAAAKALAAIGPAAAPAVPELTRALDDPAGWVRAEAAMALGAIGPAAAGAAPAMLAAQRRADFFHGGLIGSSLATLGPSVVPPLIEATRDGNGNVRWVAVHTLGMMGPEARETVGRLRELARDSEGSLRVQAAFALWSIARPPEAISALAESLADPDGDARGEAARLLGEIGPDAESAVPALIEALADEKEGVRNPAANALGKIGPAAVAALPAILRASAPAYPWKPRLYAVAAAFGPAAVPALIAALDGPDDAARWTAVAALGEIGPEARAATPKLIAMTTSDRRADRLGAAVALWRIARDANVVPVLAEIACLPPDDRNYLGRGAALDALGEIGPAAAAAVPALVRQLDAVSETFAYKVVRVLGRIGPGAAAAVAPLERLSARSGDDRLRTAADEAIWRITQGEKGIAALVKELQDGSDNARGSALTALSGIGPGAAPAAAPAIAEILRDADPLNVSTAVAVLGRMGPPARPALPALIELFKDDALIDKTEVAAAIRAIDPETAAGLGIRPDRH